ncbi:MAG TPA: SOS response-associated peptidase [Syntrophomonadaceae bacterium]|nr:SOS response-associated peptidase [Syntrophomonadaceae bacterium]
MCGRYTLAVEKDELAERFGCPTVIPVLSPRYNIAPTQTVPVVVADNDYNRMTMMKWGLIPFWAKDPSMGSRMINARLESAAVKPAFKYALRQRRCLIPADGYYEWQKTSDGKRPFHIILPHQELFSFAGLWEKWNSPAGDTVCSFTILTTAPSPSVAAIHHRMPVILPREQENYWLRGLPDSCELESYLAGLNPVHQLIAYQVSNRVNSPAFDDPQCIYPV